MSFKPFDRVVHIAPGSPDDHFVAAQLALAAKEALREAQGAGEATTNFVRAVNARQGVPEEQVKTPGAIVYGFDWTPEATTYALAWLRAAAPKRSGRYARSFIVISQGHETNASAISLGAGALLVNTQPYSRKIQVGARGFSSRRGLFDKARTATLKEFRGLVSIRVKFVELAGAYRLKSGSARRRKDRRAGAALTYPALEILSEQVVAH